MNQILRQSNECLIDFLRFSLPDASMEKVADLLGISLSDFTSEKKGSPFPTYDSHYSFADIIIHQSDHHNNLLVNLSGQGCRQYEEYMSSVEGWHWQKFLVTILKAKGTVTRVDLAMDLFDGSSPPVAMLQKYVKNGQLSSQIRYFREVNSGQLQKGV
ncbi:replication initiation factor domain-containing protein, partial [Enterococcus faecalis]|nr:replication initiation factor domain-containing protein [Enterococcus faecalis]